MSSFLSVWAEVCRALVPTSQHVAVTLMVATKTLLGGGATRSRRRGCRAHAHARGTGHYQLLACPIHAVDHLVEQPEAHVANSRVLACRSLPAAHPTLGHRPLVVLVSQRWKVARLDSILYSAARCYADTTHAAMQSAPWKRAVDLSAPRRDVAVCKAGCYDK